MPPGRPPKRPSDAGDGHGAVSPSGSKSKQVRIERGPGDFSDVVKNKYQSHTRTGQACDRCKVRKIRCDALPEGCSHCVSQNLECLVTSRVSGRSERRGYTQELEREKLGMLAHIRDMEKLLQANGIEVRPWEWTTYGQPCPPGLSFDNMGNPIQDPTSKDQWSQLGSVWVKNYQGKPHDLSIRPQGQGGYSSGYTRSSLLETRPTEGYLGVHMDSAPLSSIKGTRLSILGTTIDTTSFDAPDMDEPPPGTPAGSPLYNKSLAAFLQSALRINPEMENIDLPSRREAFVYAQWYFLMIHPFMPVLHQPSFLQLLTRIYDEDGFKPTTCELVTAHMVYATIYFQYGIRNRDEPDNQARLNDLSNKHYHWSLSKFYDLSIESSVTAVQALTMIALHTRNFPKPACSCKIVNLALSRAIELNLHRAVKVPGGGTNIDNEVRKRIWWAILGLAVTLNGRLGRPMPITLEEFDVEFPVAVSDQYITDDGVAEPSKVGSCEFLVGLTGFKMVPLYLEMFSSIYSVRRDPSKYIGVVRELEEGMQAILKNLPDELKVDTCQTGQQLFALYTQAMGLEFYLCLRHPSVCMTTDAKFCAENTRTCEDTARKLLDVVTALLDLKCLDTTWYQLSVYVAAIFSSLVAHWERRFDITTTEVGTLRTEMKMWMRVVNEIGMTLGTGIRISDEVGGIIDRTIGWIEHEMNNVHRKGSRPPDQQVAIQDAVPQPSFRQNGLHSTAMKPDPGGQDVGAGPSVNGFGPNDQQRNALANNNGYYDPGLTGSVGAEYSASAAYPDQSTTVNHAPNSSGMPTAGGYDANGNGQYLYAQVASNGPASGLNQSSETPNPLIAFASQAAAQVGVGQPGSVVDEWRQPQTTLIAAADAAQAQAQAHGGTGWHEWTAAMADNQTERYSANALLNLGAGRPGDGNPAAGSGDGISVPVSADMGLAGAAGPAGHSGQWPLLLFHDGNGAVGSTYAGSDEEANSRRGC